MMNSSQADLPDYNHVPESSHAVLGIVPNEQSSRGAVSSVNQASIGKSLVIHGEISGTESLFVDGKVDGNISLPGNRVTVGRNGNVEANISAREIVIMGKVRGNVTATDRVDIRADGAVIGDVRAAHLRIEDGAFFKGAIDVRKVQSKPVYAINAALATVNVLKEA
jgi:cytoskeletal protein CcmA (bactofilin family)